ncbi:class I adenylate-forming enzyme family protein [Bordetella petrii]|uniref:class I adenylate-forming enzyme family protein n=1 Tax=Bordetella petrii TaxID=94624 RepID=UPI00048C2CB0|nr:AMP-binding protein [Bordetella petrii]
MNIANWLHGAALLHPDNPALFRADRLHADYRAFAQRAAGLARWLAGHGVTEGDRVALFMKNRVEYLELFYACWWIGAMVVPVNPKLHPKEVAWILGDSQARIVLTDTPRDLPGDCVPAACLHLAVDSPAYEQAARAGLADGLRAPLALAPEALAWLFYTSGTTGRPKGVMLSHRNLAAMALCYAADVETVTAGDSMLYAAPMSHGAGLYHFVYVRRAARHIVPASRGFDPAEILDTAEACGSLSLFAAPTMVKRLVEQARRDGRDGRGLHTIIYGGGPMYQADMLDALQVLGPRFAQIYGQGESPMTITALAREIIADSGHPRWQARLASVGVAQSCMEVRVVDSAMADVPAGAEGEVIVRGDAVMAGYWNNEAATRATLVDGWLRTGDIGRLDQDGFLTLTDRCKDVIISGGSNIYPREVEEVLARHPAVHEVAVVGAPSAQWGEEVVAFVVLRPGAAAAADELDRWCRAEIAAFKTPKRYCFRAELPKNSYGKIPKTQLRESLQAETAARPGTA